MASEIARQRQDTLYSYLFSLPALSILTLIILVPILLAGYGSFFEYTIGSSMEYVGSRNYARILSDPVFWSSAWRTVVFTVFSLVLQYAVGLGLALLLARRFPFQRLWIALLVSPAAISPVVAAVIWRYMMGFDGVINYALSHIGIDPVQWLSRPVPAFAAVVVVMVWRFYPMIMLVLYSSRIAMPQEVFDAAEVDGASGWQVFRSITFPLLIPASLVAVSFRLIFTFREFATPWLITQGGPTNATNFLAIHMYRQAFIYWNSGMGSAVASMIMLFTVLLSIGYMRLMYKHMFTVEA